MEIIRIILPIAIFVLTVVYIIKTVNKKAKQDKENIEEDNEKEDNEENNYMAEGMAIGMGWGTAIGIAFGMENIAIFTGIGMLLGMVAGMNIKKWSSYYVWNNLLASTYVGAFLLNIPNFFKIKKITGAYPMIYSHILIIFCSICF